VQKLILNNVIFNFNGFLCFMEDSLFGVIIKVENIDICRSFYRDVLDIGPPVLDSNFWVEFRVPGCGSLILEKADEDETLAVVRGRISWIYRVEDVRVVLDRMEEYGFEAETKPDERLGYKVYLLRDPEGNQFYLTSSKESADISLLSPRLNN
jgi:predicted enzyme related to lactoylglutathione lyase